MSCHFRSGLAFSIQWRLPLFVARWEYHPVRTWLRILISHSISTCCRKASIKGLYASDCNGPCGRSFVLLRLQHHAKPRYIHPTHPNPQQLGKGAGYISRGTAKNHDEPTRKKRWKKIEPGMKRKNNRGLPVPPQCLHTTPKSRGVPPGRSSIIPFLSFLISQLFNISLVTPSRGHPRIYTTQSTPLTHVIIISL